MAHNSAGRCSSMKSRAISGYIRNSLNVASWVWVCCFSSSSALDLKNDPNMLSQEGTAHNDVANEDVFLLCKAVRSDISHINCLCQVSDPPSHYPYGDYS